MSQPLHLKYRPQTLTDLVGQPAVQTCLTQAIQRHQIAPAYLFCGPRGTGKTSTARILAKSLNCLSHDGPTATPCGTCSTCKGIVNGSALDVTEIDAASHGGVEDARELVKTCQLAAAQCRYRVVIIDEAHMLTSQAQNALLKLIEEPPARVVFVLATTEPHKVLPTINSRCLSFEFRPIAQSVIKRYLAEIVAAEAIQVGDSAITAIARLCKGGLRDALQLVAKAALLDSETQVTAQDIYRMVGQVGPGELKALVTAAQTRNVVDLMQGSRELIETGHTPEALHLALLEVYHDLLLLLEAPGQNHLLTSLLTKQQLQPLAQNTDVSHIYQALDILEGAERQLRFSPTPQPWLEATLLKLMPQPAQSSRQPVRPTTRPTPDAEPSLAQAWSRVLDTAQPKAKALLQDYCQLSHIDLARGVATLVVDSAKKATLTKHKNKVQGILETAMGQSIQLTLVFTEVDPDHDVELAGVTG
ncbi:DNA polymerase III subunit gamma/tau [Phormidium sp. FACHB-1136]|uniref:DNA polymerase III subunit gamma/tau n=1 Tax=Phormidium sp. FACHB-1136 TaxID=2692848 RepID=UPI0016855948|nr:DNA polymerase III subunit gamma/tau [Phormidium sp. FACHB-1136]MBD2428091.1 DNA polymerase III subunit gamma/tau [Phormidium sp. FACHB-1136]